MQLTRKSLILCEFALLCLPINIYPQQDYHSESSDFPFSILITEVLYDPEPRIELPGWEYIELFNNSGDTVEMAGWTIRVGEKLANLTSFNLAPGKFLILTSDSGLGEFSFLNGEVIAPEKWLTLRNSGQFIALLSPLNNIIHNMSYHPALYDDLLKREGGWSLELADFDYPCNQNSWIPSIDSSGGTPGRMNSVAFKIDQYEIPKPLRIGLLDNNKLGMILDGPVTPLTNNEWFIFDVNPPQISVEDWDYYNGRPWLIEIVLDDIIPEGIVFSLAVSGKAYNCAGFDLLPQLLEFGIAEPPCPGDVVISEILFDPLDRQAEFVCIHNNSGKILALNELYLATCDEEGRVSRSSKPHEESFLMFPGREYVLTSDADIIKEMSDESSAGRISERSDMPSLPNSGSGLCIMNSKQQILDFVRYNPDWQSNVIGESKGYSLERIRLDQDGNVSSNWHTASFLSGGSTPGLPNSQGSMINNYPDLFSLENHVFSPDNDGHSDFIIINAAPGESGWTGRAGVYNLSGNLIKVLFEPAILPSEGSIKWDGTDEYGRIVPTGYYVIILNYKRADGLKGRWKEACFLSG